MAMLKNQPDKKNISYEDIFEARKIAAKIIAVYGEIYLPIFERLHAELHDFEAKKKLKELAIQIAL